MICVALHVEKIAERWYEFWLAITNFLKTNTLYRREKKEAYDVFLSFAK
jgi:hypothetical protein